MAVRDLEFNYGIDVSALTPRYKLMAANGTLGAAVNPLTAGVLVNAATGSYFSSQVDIGSSRAVLWYCDTAALAGLQSFYGDQGIDSGAGAYAATVTVTDGSNPLQNAVVRVTNGITSIALVTDASGHATFGLDAATYTVVATKAGYSFVPTTRTVTGNQAGTLINNLVMTQTVIPTPPADPTMGTVYGYIYPTAGGTKAGYVMTANLLHPNTQGGAMRISTDLIAARLPQTDASDADGLVTLDLVANALITPQDSYWLVAIEGTNFSKKIKVLAGTTQDLGALIV